MSTHQRSAASFFSTFSLLTFYHLMHNNEWGTGVRADERLGNTPQRNQETLVVEDKVGKLSGELGCDHAHGVPYFFLQCSDMVYAVWLSRKDLRLLVGLLTGHNTLNRHLTLLRITYDPLCPLCKVEEEEDISLHLLGNCCAIAEKWCEFFGRYFLGTGDLRQEHWSILLRFAKTCRRFL